MAAELARQKRHDAIICLGAVIRGDTPHFDYVAGNAASGLAHIAAETGVPVAFGVLTTNTVEQAMDRAGAKSGNKGFDAAMTAIEMANLLQARFARRSSNVTRTGPGIALFRSFISAICAEIAPEEAFSNYYGGLYSEEAEEDAGARQVHGGAGARHVGPPAGDRQATSSSTPNTGAWSACRRWTATFCGSRSTNCSKQKLPAPWSSTRRWNWPGAFPGKESVRVYERRAGRHSQASSLLAPKAEPVYTRS